MDEMIQTDGPRDVRQALDACRAARGPQEFAQALFLAVSYQQQQIEALELALGLQNGDAMDGIRERARKLFHERAERGPSGGLVL